MRILVIADLDIDQWDRDGQDLFTELGPILQTIDALIIAGDLTNDPLRNWPGALVRLGQCIDPSKVFVVPGNHDYYHWHLQGDQRLREITEDAGMSFAQQSVLTFGNLRLLCCTLWSDFQLNGDRETAMWAAERGMNDYRLISSDRHAPRAVAQDTLSIHVDHLEWLTARIREPFPGRTVIVTHHCPSPAATGRVDKLTPAFTSNLDSWIQMHAPDLWLFGHTHRRLSARVGRTPVVNISLGYPSEIWLGEVADVVQRGLIDTDAPDFLVATVGAA